MKYILSDQGNNGAYIHESENRTKEYDYNDQWFRTMNDVNKYISDTRIVLIRKEHYNIPTIEIENLDDLSMNIEYHKNCRFK